MKTENLGGRVIKEEKPVNKKAIIAVAVIVALLIAASIVLLSLWRAGMFEKDEGGSLYTHDAQKGFKEYYIEGGECPGTYAIMTVTDGTRTVDAEIYLLEDIAPITCKNFIEYAKSGFYDDTVIHRIVDKTYTFQGGGMVYKDDKYVTKENKNDPIVGEFKNNKTGNYSYNMISHFAGTIAMARTSDSNSATSGFYISWNDYPGWNGDYAAFGFIVDKEDIAAIKEMALATQKDANDYPKTVITVTKMEIVEKK